MTKMNRLGTALTAIGLVSTVTACAGPNAGPKSASIFGGKVDKSNIGLATKAQIALSSNDLTTALELGERAVENSPRDAGFRALLGNIYLASGRYSSAEQAYRDSLSMVGSQPQVALKLALVQIALGKKDDAVSGLYAAQSQLDASDLGLALALAGRPQQAVEVLEPAARAIGADARLRQNLALAYALAGNWDSARNVAAQDLAPESIDARMQEWAALASPDKTGAQVAAFIGIAPVARDPGQPTRLALNISREQLRTASVDPLPVVAVPQAVPVVAQAPAYVAQVRAPVEVAHAPQPEVAAPAPVAVAVAAPAELAPPPMPAPRVAAARPVARPTRAAPVGLASSPAPVRLAAARPSLTPAAVRITQSVRELRHNAAQRVEGRSKAVVQLGAYSSRQNINAAWSQVAGRHAALRNYTPVTARFDGAQGTFYRLAVKGFASDREAISLCLAIKRSGGSCFVRAASNDAPVQLASR